ncbi:MAG: cytochrome c3 family protein [Pyrinomonadaceae bacterium]
MIRTATFALFICFFSGGFLYQRAATETLDPSPKNEAAENGLKYSEFPHDKHKQSCNSCHKFPSANWKTVRKGDEAFPDITDYPRHESCLKCHRQQFFGSPKPAICSICHTNPSPRNSSRHPFPNPREIFDRSPKGKRAVSDFAVFFPHDKHIDIVSRLDRGRDAKEVFVRAGWRRRVGEESCSVCHQTYMPQGDSDDEYVTPPPKDVGDAFWLKKGIFKTAPIGHKTCYTCHSEDTGILPAPQDCAVCHKLKPKETEGDFLARAASEMGITDKIMLTAWRRRDSSGTFRHEWFSHAELECANCHNVGAMNTLDAATKKVSVQSCSGCHITATSDDGGILNYEVDQRKANPKFQCVKCHIVYGGRAIPESHERAIAAQAGD